MIRHLDARLGDGKPQAYESVSDSVYIEKISARWSRQWIELGGVSPFACARVLSTCTADPHHALGQRHRVFHHADDGIADEQDVVYPW